MRIGSARHVVCALVLFGWSEGVLAIDPPPKLGSPSAQPDNQGITKSSNPPKPLPPLPTNPNDRADLRAEVENNLKELAQVAEKDLTPTQKTLKDLWTKRIDLLDEWDKTIKNRQLIENPKPSPERETADRKLEMDRARAQLELLKKSPESVLPDLFKTPIDRIDDAKLGEMRDAIEAAQGIVKEKTKESENLRGEPAARTASLAANRTARDKLHTEVSGLPTLRLGAESAIFKAPNEVARKIAREEYALLKCKAGLAGERLILVEAKLALETKRIVTCEAAIQSSEAELSLANATLAAMTDRYKGITERQKAVLIQAAKKEQKRAETVDDPLEKFKALRTAELLSLEAINLEDAKTLATSPELSLEDQRNLADHATTDFESLKQMVKKNQLGGIVALRLNNDFRRISHERAILIRYELAQSSAANTFYENALTEAELNYFNDARDDRFERDAFIQTLPPSRHATANAMIDELEKRHQSLLFKRKRES